MWQKWKHWRFITLLLGNLMTIKAKYIDKITEKFNEYCNSHKMSPEKGAILTHRINSLEKLSISM